MTWWYAAVAVAFLVVTAALLFAVVRRCRTPGSASSGDDTRPFRLVDDDYPPG